MSAPRKWSPTSLVMIGGRSYAVDPMTRAVTFRRLVERYEAMLDGAPAEDVATIRTAAAGARDLLHEAEREFWREAGFGESA